MKIERITQAQHLLNECYIILERGLIESSELSQKRVYLQFLEAIINAQMEMDFLK